MLYMDYAWTSDSRECFHQTSHRSRYLNCDAISNLPPDPTPLYRIQFHYHPAKALFNIPASVSVVQTDVALYCTSDSQLLQAVGMWARRDHQHKKPRGADGHMRLNQIPYLWEIKRPQNRLRSAVEWRACLLYTSPSPRDGLLSRMPSSA